MARVRRLWIVIGAALLTLTCAQPTTEETTGGGSTADPTVVDADHYTAEFENDRVRVLRIAYGPGERSVLHTHPDGVAVFLTDHHVRFEMPDGSTSESHYKAGEHFFAPGGPHIPENIGAEPMELLLVELKAAPTATTTGEPGPDPTVVDPAHYATEFENERVRVLRIAYGPGEKSVLHDHPDGVAVFLTDHHVRFGMPDGSTTESHYRAGEHFFAPGGPHIPESIGTEPMELVLVELK